MAFLAALAPAAAGAAGAAAGGASVLSTLGTVAGLAGAGVQAIGSIRAGQGADAAARAQAKQLDMKAAEDRAVAQRESFEERRQGVLLQSNMLAAAAAGGADVSDPGVMDLLLDSAAVTKQNERLASYQGEVSARNNTFAAQQQRIQGKQARTGSFFSAGGQLLSGLSGVAGYAQKYG